MSPDNLTAANNKFTINSKHPPVYLILVYEQSNLCSVSLSLLSFVKVAATTLCIKHANLLYKGRAYLSTLTEVIGDVIRNVDFPISPLAPLAALAGAGVCVFLGRAVNGDVSFNQVGIISRTD